MNSLSEFEKEEWRTIPGWDKYEISNLGRLKGKKREVRNARGGIHIRDEIMLHPKKIAYLTQDGRCQSIPIEKLKKMAFGVCDPNNDRRENGETQSMKKADYDVYVSTEYDKFKLLEGNRAITQGRVKKTKESIQQIGWIRQPIVVNEKYEIIDGQGRFQALKELELPIEYIIDEGIGVEECRTMNIHQSNWRVSDYIESYASLGNENYIRLKTLLGKHKGIGMFAINMAIHGIGKNNNISITDGSFFCSKRDFQCADELISELEEVRPYTCQIKGRVDLLECAVVFIFKFTDADHARLKKVLKDQYANIAPIATFENAFRELESFYNLRYRGKLQNFYTQYLQEVRDNKIHSRSHQGVSQKSNRRLSMK